MNNDQFAESAFKSVVDVCPVVAMYKFAPYLTTSFTLYLVVPA